MFLSITHGIIAFLTYIQQNDGKNEDTIEADDSLDENDNPDGQYPKYPNVKRNDDKVQLKLNISWQPNGSKEEYISIKRYIDANYHNAETVFQNALKDEIFTYIVENTKDDKKDPDLINAVRKMVNTPEKVPFYKLYQNKLNKYAIKAKLDRGDDPLAQDEKLGETFLHLLCGGKRRDRQIMRDIVTMICEKAPYIKTKRSKKGKTPYELAKMTHKNDILHLLAYDDEKTQIEEKLFDTTCTSEARELVNALSNGNIDKINNFLKDESRSPEEKAIILRIHLNRKMQTIVHFAILFCQNEIAIELLKFMNIVDMETFNDSDGLSLLHYAVREPSNKTLVDFLVEKHENQINVVCKSQKTPLIYAVENMSDTISLHLLDNKADIVATANDVPDYKPLFSAMTRKRRSCCKNIKTNKCGRCLRHRELMVRLVKHQKFEVDHFVDFIRNCQDFTTLIQFSEILLNEGVTISCYITKMSKNRGKLREFYTTLDDCGVNQPPLWKKISDNFSLSRERDESKSEMKIFTALEIQRFSPHCFYEIGVRIVVFLKQRKVSVKEIHNGIKEKLPGRLDLLKYLEPFVEKNCISALSEEEQEPFKVMLGSCRVRDDDWRTFCSHIVKLEDHEITKISQVKNLQRNVSPSEEMVKRMIQSKPDMSLYKFHQVLHGVSQEAANMIFDHVALLLGDHLKNVPDEKPEIENI